MESIVDSSEFVEWGPSEFYRWILEGCPKTIENVIKLNLECETLREIPEEVFYLKNLESLNLSNCNINKISSNIAKLTKLKELDLSLNQFNEIPTQIQPLDLDNLNFYVNAITKIPPWLYDMTSLVYINFGLNNIDEISSDVIKLSNLEDLNLSNNKIFRIPEQLVNLEKLKYLDLYENLINICPQRDPLLPPIQIIHSICANKIWKLDDYEKWQKNGCCMRESMSVKELHLTESTDETALLNLDKFRNLQELYVDSCAFLSKKLDLSCFTGFTSLNNLTTIDLSDNRLEDNSVCFDVLYGLPSLTSINLSYNFLTDVPEKLLQMPNLKNLNISSNNIVHNVGKLTIKY